MYRVQHHAGGAAISSNGCDYITYSVRIPVTPQYSGPIDSTVTLNASDFYNHPLAYFSRLAFYWRGSLEYRIAFTNPNVLANIVTAKASFIPLPFSHYADGSLETKVSTSSDAGLGVCTGYNQTAPFQYAHPPYQDSLDKYGFELEQTWQQGVLSVVVPYASHMPYTPLAANVPLYSSTVSSDTYYPLESVTGWLNIQVILDVSAVDQLPSGSALHYPNFDIYMGSGDDFRYLMQAPPGAVSVYPLLMRTLPKD
nr:MAG: hypothetical protein [Picornavirales sp.]